MPLDREKGEFIEGLGLCYRVVPTDKWASTPMFMEAAEAATLAFRKTAGRFHHRGSVMKFGRDHVLAQEYPLHDTLAFVFEAKVDGEWMVYPYTFRFPAEMINRMSVEGQWDCTVPKVH